MLSIPEILTIERTFVVTSVPSKKKAFELIAQTFALSAPSLEATHIFDQLVARERLGSTAIGHGVAIPHCRLPILHAMGCFILLKEGLPLNAPDNIPVNMFFALAVPLEATDSHLALLAAIAQGFHNENFRQSLLQANSRSELYEQLSNITSAA